MSFGSALLAAAATSFTLPAGTSVCTMPAAARAPTIIAMGAKKSRYGDDGTRLKGQDIGGAMEAGLGKGFFSGFKWGTEVDVGPKGEAKAKKSVVVGDGAGSDRGLGGNNAYRNTESARLVRTSAARRPTSTIRPCASPAHCAFALPQSDVDEGQRIRKQRLDAYINSTEEPADKTFGKILAGSFIFVLIGLLGGVVAYYGVDGLVAAPTRMSF